MHTLTPTLIAAGKAPISEPAVRVRLVDAIAGVPRWRVSVWRAGSGLDAPHDAALFGDGSVLRARISGGVVEYQRVTAPAAGSSWGSFATLGTPFSGNAIACAAAALFGAVVAGDGAQVAVSTTNDAVAWAGWSVIGSGDGPVAVAQRPDGDRAAFWADGSTLCAKRQTASVWDSTATTDSSFSAITGIAAMFDGADWRLIVTGTGADGIATTWHGTWGDDGFHPAGVFQPWIAIWTSDGVFTAPHLAMADGIRLTIVEDAADGVHILESWLPGTSWDSERFRQPVPLPGAVTAGIALAGLPGGAVYRFGPDRVEGGAIQAAVDVSHAVIHARWTQATDGGRCSIDLEDSAGLIDAHIGQQIEIAAGYTTSAGDEHAPAAIYWTETVERCVERGRRTVRLGGRDVRWLLDRESARQPRQWAAGDASVAAMIRQVAAEAGVVCTAGGSAASVLPGPAVVLPTGASIGSLVNRLLRLLPDRLIAAGSGLRSVEPLTGEISVYTFGTDHPLRRHVAGEAATQPAALRVLGNGVAAWQQDDTAITLLPSSSVTVAERGWDDATGIAGAASGLFDDARRERIHETAVCHPCVGLEVLDVVTIDWTDRRVLSIDLQLDRRNGCYQQTLTLGAV